MSQENVERFRDALIAWNDEDVERCLAAADPAFIFHTSGAFLPHDPVYVGHPGFRAFWRAFHEAWERLDVDIARMEDLDDRVLALMNFDAVGRASGVRVQRQIANLASFERGLIVDLRAYGTWREALRAVGLEE
ncbi:MAG TPA: nuclear transport factor 2 family protein [Solirubrobacteraceae bacterium]|nr:nuclear transport factor 2 family protein [Solirubrobacteraceae bacterium]